MAKDSAFFCSECGYESSKWQGQCPSCRAWNTFVEAPKEAKTKKRSAAVSSLPVLMKDIKTDDDERVLSGYKELDRVLGGGLVRGSLVLVGGDPGIGKSTLLLQACGRYIKGGQRVLYVSGEESLRQIKLRSDRLKDSDDMLSLLCETDLGIIEEQIKENI